MRKILLILFLILLVSCEPAYQVYITNKSPEKIYIETENPIESYLAIKKGSAYDSIVSKKINSSTTKGLYQLNPNDKIDLFGHIGGLEENHFTYKSVKIIKGSDTIEIEKNNLSQRINKKIKNFYYIEIN